MRRSYKLAVHQIVRDRIPSELLDLVVHWMLSSIDKYLNSEEQGHKTSILSIAKDKEGKEIPVKIVLARGKEEDSVILTIPKPVNGELVFCETCQGIGYLDLGELEICESCNGLGRAEIKQGNL